MEAIKIHGVPGTRQTMGPEPRTSLGRPLLASSRKQVTGGSELFLQLPIGSNQFLDRIWGPLKTGYPQPSQVLN